MDNNWQETFRTFCYHRIPLLATFLMMLIFLVPINSIQGNYFQPMIGMICVYYWSLKKAHMFGLVSAFCVGIMQDIYSSSPLGINCLLMMLLTLVTMPQPRYFQTGSFAISWLIFSLIACLFIFCKYLFLCLYYKYFLPLNEIIPSYLSTVMFYPLIVYVCVGIQKILPQERLNE